MNLAELHDMLMGVKPDDAEHDSASCRFCKQVASNQEDEEVSEKLYTQEQLDALVASAVEKASADVSAESDTEILNLNERLEEAEKALAERDAKIADLEASIAERDEAERLASVAAERAELVKESVNFTDEQIEARKAAWAKMGDEDFASYLEDLKTARTAASKSKEDTKPVESAFDGTREVASEDQEERDVIKDFFSSVENLRTAELGA